jgi:hypothetical protein
MPRRQIRLLIPWENAMAKKQKTGKKAAKAASKLQKAATSPAVKKVAASKNPPKKR